MKYILSYKDKKIILYNYNGAFISAFSDENQAFEYLKNHIPVRDDTGIKDVNFIVDDNIKGSYKIILKNLISKMDKYQQSKGMNKTFFDVKNSIFRKIESPVSYDTDKTSTFFNTKRHNIIKETCEKFLDDNIELSNEKVICQLLADVTVEAVLNYLEKLESSMQIKDLSQLKSTLNILINRGYEEHKKDKETYDLISLRNKLSTILLNKGVIG